MQKEASRGKARNAHGGPWLTGPEVDRYFNISRPVRRKAILKGLLPEPTLLFGENAPRWFAPDLDRAALAALRKPGVIDPPQPGDDTVQLPLSGLDAVQRGLEAGRISGQARRARMTFK